MSTPLKFSPTHRNNSGTPRGSGKATPAGLAASKTHLASRRSRVVPCAGRRVAYCEGSARAGPSAAWIWRRGWGACQGLTGMATLISPHRRAYGLTPVACRLPLKGGVMRDVLPRQAGRRLHTLTLDPLSLTRSLSRQHEQTCTHFAEKSHCKTLKTFCDNSNER